MTTYVQTTIHSKIAKFQKTSTDVVGSLMKGRLAKLKSYHHNNRESQFEISKEIQVLPKNKVNINRKMKNKVIPGVNKGEEIILMESGVFPAVYFKKTTMRNVLKEFIFPENVRALPPSDDRTPLIFQIISNLFSEITFYIFNILIGENTVTNSFYIFFSDSETIPFTKCCNAPVYIELMQNGSGKLLCNSLKCPHSNIAQFLINFQDGKKLWKHITYFADASEKDKELRQKISKLIINGKYKKCSLVNIVQETSKEIVDLFYTVKKNKEEESHDLQYTEEQQNKEDQFAETPFITANAAQNQQNQYENEQEQYENEGDEEITLQQILHPEENNIDILKMKIHYMARNQKDLQKKLAKGIINEGKVFHKNFQMIKKIDQFMLNQRNSKTSTRINFPRIMDQMKKTKDRSMNPNKNKSQSLYHSFAG